MTIQATLAQQTYALNRSAAAPAPSQGTDRRIESGLGDVAGGFARVLSESEGTAKAALTGRADPQTLVEALAASELAVETVVTVRNKVVEAYQEILRMPV